MLDSEEEDVKEGGSAEAENSVDRRGSVDRNSTSSIMDGTPGRRKSNAETQVAQASGEARPKQRRKVLPGQINDLNPPKTEAQIIAEQ